MGIGRTNAAGGADISGVTATVNDVLDTADFVDANGDLLTGAIPSLAGTTFNVSDSNRTIQAGQYIAGDLTLRAVTTSNITAANIKSGVTVNVGDSNNEGRIKSITGTLESCNVASGTFWGTDSSTGSVIAPAGFNSSSTVISYYVMAKDSSTGVSSLGWDCVQAMVGSGKSSSEGMCIYRNQSLYKGSCRLGVSSNAGTTYLQFVAPVGAKFGGSSLIVEYTYLVVWR